MGAHARQLSRLRLKSLSILKPEINGEFCAILLEIEANFQPLALVTYARYDPAVKDKHSLHDIIRMFVLYGGVVPCVCDQREWLEVGL